MVDMHIEGTNRNEKIEQLTLVKDIRVEISQQSTELIDTGFGDVECHPDIVMTLVHGNMIQMVNIRVE